MSKKGGNVPPDYSGDVGSPISAAYGIANVKFSAHSWAVHVNSKRSHTVELVTTWSVVGGCLGNL